MDLHRGIILVVDDDADFRELLVDHLAAEGHAVQAAANGVEALHALAAAQGRIRLVLLDLRMPILDGFEVCRVAARAPELARVPIAIMTAEHETREIASAPGVVAVLHKPLDLRELGTLAAAHAAGPPGAAPARGP